MNYGISIKNSKIAAKRSAKAHSKKLLLVIAMLFSLVNVLSGCAHYTYEGKITSENSSGNTCDYVLHWTKSAYIFRQSKISDASLTSSCSPRVLTFSQAKGGIYFYGDPGKDQIDKDSLFEEDLAKHNAHKSSSVTNERFICGKIINKKSYHDIREGPLALTIKCKPMQKSEFDIVDKPYLKSKKGSYLFDISETRVNSLGGKIDKGPEKTGLMKKLN